MKAHLPASFHCGDSYRIQTYNLLIRSQMLYSVELTSHHILSFADAKLQLFSVIANYFFKLFSKAILQAIHIGNATGPNPKCCSRG